MALVAVTLRRLLFGGLIQSTIAISRSQTARSPPAGRWRRWSIAGAGLGRFSRRPNLRQPMKSPITLTHDLRFAAIEKKKDRIVLLGALRESHLYLEPSFRGFVRYLSAEIPVHRLNWCLVKKKKKKTKTIFACDIQNCFCETKCMSPKSFLFPFSRGFPRFYSVLLGLPGFYWVLMGFNGFYWVLLGFPLFFFWILLGFTKLNWVFLGFTGFPSVLLVFSGFYWVLLSFTGFYWILLDFSGFYWVYAQ